MKGGSDLSQQLIEKIVGEVLSQLGTVKVEQAVPINAIPVAVSARHVHLSQEHIERLFGKGYKLTKKNDLSQPNQFAANEIVNIAGPKGSLERVRVLGPARSFTQAEVSWTDAIKLGVKPPLRDSGNIKDSAAFTLIGPKGSLYLDEGLIIAQAHIHMTPDDAKNLEVQSDEYVTVEIDGVRPIAYQKVKIRVSERYRLEMHIDTDEANAGLISQGAVGRIRQVDEERPSNYMQQSKTEASVKNHYNYQQKLLSNEDIRKIKETEIMIGKGTIVTALARDTARELGKVISIRN